MSYPPHVEILIVDDDTMTALVHSQILKQLSVRIDSSLYADGQEALDYICHHPNPNTTFLVFLDLKMPVMDGWEFLDQCKLLKNYQNICVVVITSSINSEDLYRALEYKNVMGFSSKPFTRKSMTSLLDFPAVQNLFLEMEYEAFENDTW